MADRYASLTAARARTQAIIKRLEDMTPVLRAVAPKFEALIRKSFDAQRSPAGQQFKRLAASTLAQRKPGEGTVALKKTGKTYASIRVFASSKNGLVFIFPAHLLIHAKAHGSPLPKRNVLPFEMRGGRMQLIPKAELLIRDTLRAYHLEGKIIELPMAAE